MTLGDLSPGKSTDPFSSRILFSLFFCPEVPFKSNSVSIDVYLLNDSMHNCSCPLETLDYSFVSQGMQQLRKRSEYKQKINASPHILPSVHIQRRMGKITSLSPPVSSLFPYISLSHPPLGRQISKNWNLRIHQCFICFPSVS